ncbi:MAG: hypothetical protein CME64_08520 [Halobacteriovoraceae bacterium]|nr:hypothetical protein [Halobacteriovoraceae bacterium]
MRSIRMRNIWLMMALICAWVAGPGAYGQERLSLEEATKLALKRSENVQQAAIEVQRAQAQIKEAWASVLPQISANFQSIRHTKSPVIQIGDTSARIKEDWEMLSSLQLNQVIYSFGRVSHALDLAKISQDARQSAKEAVEREIRFAVEVAYFNALSAQEVLQIAKDSHGNAKKNLEALQKRFQGGRVPRFDNIRMAADIASRAPIVSDAQKNLRLAFLQLNLLTEMPIESQPRLTTSMSTLFPVLDKSKLLDEAYENPSLKSIELAAQIAQKQTMLAKAEHYPTISAFGQLNHGGTGDTFQPEDERMFTSSAIGLSLNIPIFEGGAVKARHQQAALDAVKAKIELKKQKEILEVELASAIEEYKANIQKFAAAKKAVGLAKRGYELTRTRFETGGATRNDLNTAESSLTNARIQQQTALFQIYQNRASIKRFTKGVVAK